MSMGKRTKVQVKCPHVIQEFPVDLTTEDEDSVVEEEEVGTDHRNGMAVATNRPGSIGQDAGPPSRYGRSGAQETLISWNQ
jgi:hypothetical protein